MLLLWRFNKTLSRRGVLVVPVFALIGAVVIGCSSPSTSGHAASPTPGNSGGSPGVGFNGKKIVATPQSAASSVAFSCCVGHGWV
jgi:hypothetical protein